MMVCLCGWQGVRLAISPVLGFGVGETATVRPPRSEEEPL